MHCGIIWNQKIVYLLKLRKMGKFHILPHASVNYITPRHIDAKTMIDNFYLKAAPEVKVV